MFNDSESGGLLAVGFPAQVMRRGEALADRAQVRVGEAGVDERRGGALEGFEAAMLRQRRAFLQPSRLIDLERRAQFGRFGFIAR